MPDTPPGKQTPHGRIHLGEVEIFALCDLVADFPRSFSKAFPDLPSDRVQEFRDRYPETWSGEDTWLLHAHCYLIRSEGRVILVDTGIGPVGTVGQKWIRESGGLPKELMAAKVSYDDVDTVVITHCHLDHIGWNLSTPALRVKQAERGPTFPRARYMVHRSDWEAFPKRGDEIDKAAFEQSIRPLHQAGVLEVLEEDRALTGAVRITHAPGHTPGHVVVEIESGVDRAVVSGDLVNHPALIHDPGWRYAGDMDSGPAIRTRREFLERIETRGEILATAHFPQPFGKVLREGDERYWEPMEAEP